MTGRFRANPACRCRYTIAPLISFENAVPVAWQSGAVFVPLVRLKTFPTL